MKNIFQNLKDALGEELAKGLCVTVCFIMIFSAGNFAGLISNVRRVDSDVAVDATEQTQAQVADTTVQTTVATTVATTQATTQAATQPTQGTPEAVQPSETTPSTPASSGPQTKAEIVAYFNECSNKVKTEATKVVRNYTENRLIEDKLDMPSALEGLFSSAAGSFLKKDETPLELLTQDDIIRMYPVQKQTWSSQATEADVAEATCTEEGEYYNITLKFHPQDNPVLGSGIGATFFLMNLEQVKSYVPGLQSMDVSYFDCVVQAKIEKSTGRVVWSNYSTPMVALATVKVITKEVPAQMGMIIINDYSVTY